MRLSAMANGYLKFFGARGASPRTVEGYELTYGQFVAFLISRGEDDDVRAFTPDNVEAFSSFLAERGLRASSVNVKLAGLKSLGEYGMKTRDPKGKYLLAENPLARVYRPKAQRAREKYLVADELRSLLALPKPVESQLAIELLVDTALRASEVAGANVSDLSLNGDRLLLTVRVKGGSIRQVTLGAEVSEKLLASLKFREARPEDPLVVNEHGERYTRTSLSGMVQRTALRAGITRHPVRSHVLRHSVATLASMVADVPTVAEMLNHSNTQTVSRYIHRKPAVDAARDAVRAALALPSPTTS